MLYGTVTEKKTEGEVFIRTKAGNTIKRKAEPNNAAFAVVSQSGNLLAKSATELKIT